MRIRIILTVLAILVIPENLLIAQVHGMISGTVLDEKTRTPVPYATVFLATTALGGTADENGSYTIMNIPPGKYNVVASSVGYKRTTLLTEVSGSPVIVNITLNSQTTVLKEVVVVDNPAEYEKNLRTFKKYFLGTTRNSERCTITNISDITLSYDDETRIFTATTEKPIVVENLALGYEITYILDLFQVDYKTGYCFMSGIPRFKNLEPRNVRDEKTWPKERDRAYYGSVLHFMRSLKNKELKQNKFRMNLLIKIPPLQTEIKAPKLIKNDTVFYELALSELQLSKLSDHTHPLIEVIYTGESPELRYKGRSGISSPQTSYLKFTKHNLMVHDNGYYEDPLSYFADGYWSWSNVIADLMPLEYVPSDNKIDPASPSVTDSHSDSLINQLQPRPARVFYNINGTVSAQDTHENIDGGFVCIPNSTIRSEIFSGLYSLPMDTSGRYDLLCASDKFIWQCKNVKVDSSVKIEFQLMPTGNFKVKPQKSAARTKFENILRNELLGQTTNALESRIENLSALSFDNDSQSDSLLAQSVSPIEVINDALGYKITFFLKRFGFNYKTKESTIVGFQCFEKLIAAGADQERKWEEAKSKAYRGSFRHFMKSLKSYKLSENGFSVLVKTNGIFAPTDLEFLRLSDQEASNEVKVIYREPPDPLYPTMEKLFFQLSTVHLSKRLVDLYSPGLTDLEPYQIGGYFKWASKIPQRTPIGFTAGNK